MILKYIHTVSQMSLSYRSLRRTIGVLGIALPLLLVVGNLGVVERSISFYYHTKMSFVLTTTLIAFGFILFTYRRPQIENEKLSENTLTRFGGFCALMIALFPTEFEREIGSLFYSSNPVGSAIHSLSAVLFMLTMGVIVLIKFSRAKYFKRFYQISGSLILAGLAFTIYAYLREIRSGEQLFNDEVFWGETFSLCAFGIAWLRRGIPPKKQLNQFSTKP